MLSLSLFAETGNSIGAIQIAGTGSQTQIPFFVTAYFTLMGEEFLQLVPIYPKNRLIAGVTAPGCYKDYISVDNPFRHSV